MRTGITQGEKDKLVVLLHDEGFACFASTVGRTLWKEECVTNHMNEYTGLTLVGEAV